MMKPNMAPMIPKQDSCQPPLAPLVLAIIFIIYCG